MAATQINTPGGTASAPTPGPGAAAQPTADRAPDHGDPAGHGGSGPVASNVHQMAATKLASVSQRYTMNRRAVVDALLALPGPATIAEVLAADDTLAQSSTYRNLVVLEEVGVVHRIVTSDDHARYELTEEITGQHHHHLICESCGIIIDITLDPSVEAALERALAAGAVAHRFNGLHHRVDLVGICATCAEQATEQATEA